jgi:Flp pilus assembly protein TadD
MRGAAYGKLRELDLAVADCRKAVDLSPADPTNHANLALVYSMLGKWDKAVHESTQAITLGQVSHLLFI